MRDIKMKDLILTVFLVFSFNYIIASDRPIVSVLYLDNICKDSGMQWLSKGIADMLITGIGGSGDVVVVEREELNKVLDEQKLSLTGLTEESNDEMIGKLLNANYLIEGSFEVMNNDLRIDLKVVDARTGQIMPIGTNGVFSDVSFLVAALSSDILIKLNAKPPKIAAQRRIPLDAMKYYYIGIDKLDTGDATNAMKYFRDSADADPFYTQPEKELENGYKLLNDLHMARFQRELNQNLHYFEKSQELLGTVPFDTAPYFECIRLTKLGVTDEIELSNRVKSSGLVTNKRYLEYKSAGFFGGSEINEIYTTTNLVHIFWYGNILNEKYYNIPPKGNPELKDYVANNGYLFYCSSPYECTYYEVIGSLGNIIALYERSGDLLNLDNIDLKKKVRPLQDEYISLCENALKDFNFTNTEKILYDEISEIHSEAEDNTANITVRQKDYEKLRETCEKYISKYSDSTDVFVKNNEENVEGYYKEALDFLKNIKK